MGFEKMSLKLPEIISEEELIKVINETKHQNHRLAFALGFYECMRISEVTKLQPGDINNNLKLIWIKQAKGSKDRKIPIAPEIIKGLKHLPITCGIRALQIAFKNKCKNVLNKDLHFHTLRHSGITHYLVKKHWSSLEVQRMAGHSKITTTEIYSHINPEDLVNRMWNK
jgi:integrase/recombinase XerD